MIAFTYYYFLIYFYSFTSYYDEKNLSMMSFVCFIFLQLAIFATFQQYLIVFVVGYADSGEMITKSLASKAFLSFYHFCFLN